MKSTRRLVFSVLCSWLFQLGASIGAIGASSKEVWLTVSQNGIDSKGHSAFRRFELFPDGRVQFEASSLGRVLPGGCSPGGGLLEGRLAGAQRLELGHLALAALQSQPRKETPGAMRPRTVRRTVVLSLGETDVTGSLTENTPATQQLESALRALYSELSPTRVVSMRVKKTGPERVLVRFATPSSESVPLLLPEKASEAFSIRGFELQYERKPASEKILLSPKLRIFEIPLVMKRVAKLPVSSVLEYSTALNRHHGETGKLFSSERAPTDLYLCAEWDVP